MTPLLALARRLEQGAADDLHPCNADRRAAAQVIREAADFQRDLAAARARIAELEAKHQKLLAVMDFCGEADVSTAMDGIYQQLTGRIAELEAALQSIRRQAKSGQDGGALQAQTFLLQIDERARAALGERDG